MLLKDEQRIPLNPPMHKILCASTAYEDSFVVLRLEGLGKQETIVHLNKKGTILWQHKYEDIVNSFGMMNAKEVIVLNVADSKIDIINLESHHIIQVNHHFLFDDAAFMSIETFSDTSLFCVVEKGGVGDHRLRLTYYQYKDISDKSWPLTQWESSENEWTYEHQTKRVNNHSKMAWWLPRHQQTIEFCYFDLRQKVKGSLETVSLVNTIGQEYGIDNIELFISTLWESSTNQYMITGLSSKNDHKHKCKDANGVINNKFIIDASLGNEKAMVRETKFVFEDEEGYSFNDHLIDCFSLGTFSVFHTFRNTQGFSHESPVFYVHNQSETVVARDSWKCSCFTSNFFFPGWDGGLMVQAEHKNMNCDSVTISTKKTLDLKQISLHFLLHINEDFDDDLLQDVIELLTQ